MRYPQKHFYELFSETYHPDEDSVSTKFPAYCQWTERADPDPAPD